MLKCKLPPLTSGIKANIKGLTGGPNWTNNTQSGKQFYSMISRSKRSLRLKVRLTIINQDFICLVFNLHKM